MHIFLSTGIIEAGELFVTASRSDTDADQEKIK